MSCFCFGLPMRQMLTSEDCFQELPGFPGFACLVIFVYFHPFLGAF